MNICLRCIWVSYGINVYLMYLLLLTGAYGQTMKETGLSKREFQNYVGTLVELGKY